MIRNMQHVLVIFTCNSQSQADRSFKNVVHQTVPQESISDQIVLFGVNLSQGLSKKSEKPSAFQTFSIQEVANFVSFVAIIVSSQSPCLSKNDICETVSRNCSISCPPFFRQSFCSISKSQSNSQAFNLSVVLKFFLYTFRRIQFSRLSTYLNFTN